MDSAQIDSAISDFENRLERLRVLYEQYFMGIEKRPPEVPKKDVERRAYDLRKVRFPTTATRFRFQTLVQRYNTLQQYWNRTCREIENGTYRRHVQRAERRFRSDRPDDLNEALAPERASGEVSAAERTANDLAAMLDTDVDLDAELKSALLEAEKPAAPVPGKLGALGGSGKLGALGKREPNTAPVAPTLTLGKAIAPRAEDAADRSSTRPHPRLSMSPKPAGLQPLQKRPPTDPLRGATPPGPIPGTQSPDTRGVQAPAGGPPPAPSMRPKMASTPEIKSATETKLAPFAQAGAGDKSAAKASPGPRPLPAAARPAAARSPAAAPKPLAPAPKPLAPAPKPLAPAPKPLAPATKSPAAPAQPHAQAHTPQQPKRQGSRDLSEDRIRSLHASYLEARKKTNASAVSFEKLERSIRDTERKLREKNQGKGVDFEVSIKDGKAILKPRLK